MDLNRWGLKWGVGPMALNDLRRQMGTLPPSAVVVANLDESESSIQTRVRLEASKAGGRLWRNNVGAVKTDTGSFVRFGLANESRNMNAQVKSSDLIGINPVVITQAHVGGIIGQFMAREVKAGNWTYSGTPREEAQKKFIELVLSKGGDACFTKGN